MIAQGKAGLIRQGKAGRLSVEIYENRAALGKAAASDAAAAIERVIAEKGFCSVIFAAAPSQNEFLEALCAEDLRVGGKIDFSKVHAYHMDEYVGLSEDAPQGFGNFLRRGIFERVPFGKVEYLQASHYIAAGTPAAQVSLSQLYRTPMLGASGAIYGLLNKVSIVRLRVDHGKCIHCRACERTCKMDVYPVMHPDSAECIRCGECAQICPKGAITVGAGPVRFEKDPTQVS